MSANQVTTRRANVRIRIRRKAYDQFSQQIDEQLVRLEGQVLAAVPQLSKRKSQRGPRCRG